MPTKIFFGKNKIEEIGSEIEKYSDRILLVYGGGSIKKIGLYDKVKAILDEKKFFYKELKGVKPNPDIESVREGIALCREHDLSFVLAVGGGSVLDCAKAIAVGYYYIEDPWDFFLRKANFVAALPVGAVLTLAATGSEMNGNAVISNNETKEKRGIGGDQLKPKFSVLDPTYTFSVNSKHTAAGVVDILSHLFEQYFCPVKDAYLQDRFAETLMKVCINFGPIALKEPENYEARANLMWASSLALCGLASSGKMGDWGTHQIEHELSAVYDVTHGVGLSILTPAWMQFVLNTKTAYKFAEYAKNVWNISGKDDFESARLGIERTKQFFAELGMPVSLVELGIDNKNFEVMAEGATKFGPVGNFKQLHKEDIIEIYKLAL